MFAPFSNRGPPGVTSGLVMYVMLPTGYLATMASANKYLAQMNKSPDMGPATKGASPPHQLA